MMLFVNVLIVIVVVVVLVVGHMLGLQKVGGGSGDWCYLLVCLQGVLAVAC